MSATRMGHMRAPKTTQEKRAYYSHAPFVRAKRRPTNLANAQDDLFPSIISDRCWKARFRKRKQWMKAAPKFWKPTWEYWRIFD